MRRQNIPTRKDLKIGSKYGNLTILENIYLGGNGGSKVRVRCDCGNEYVAAKFAIKSGKIDRCIKCKDTSKRKRGIGEMTGHYWASVKRNAEIRNLEVLISKEEAYKLFLQQKRKCALSGLYIQFDNYKTKERTASLDRIDPSLNYIIGNVQWVHKKINRIKQNFTQEEFIYLCKLVIDNINNNN